MSLDITYENSHFYFPTYMRSLYDALVVTLVYVQHYVHQQFHWSRKCFTFVTDIFSCVQTTPSKSSKASQALIINAKRPSCQRLIKSSNQTLASLPNCCSQKSSRTLTCGSFHPDTLDSVLDGLPWYMCSLH